MPNQAPDCVNTVLDLSLTPRAASRPSQRLLGTGGCAVPMQAGEPRGVAPHDNAVRDGPRRFSPQASARSLWDTPGIGMTRLRLSARVDTLNAARTFSRPFMRQSPGACPCLRVPNGGSTICLRLRMSAGCASTRCGRRSRRGSCTQRVRRRPPLCRVQRTVLAQARQAGGA